MLLGTSAVALVALVGGLAGPANAAPRDNFANARLCLVNAGWRTLVTTTGQHFRTPLQCVFYALSGRSFGTTATTTPPPPPPAPTPPPPPPPPPPGD